MVTLTSRRPSTWHHDWVCDIGGETDGHVDVAFVPVGWKSIEGEFIGGGLWPIVEDRDERRCLALVVAEWREASYVKTLLADTSASSHGDVEHLIVVKRIVDDHDLVETAREETAQARG